MSKLISLLALSIHLATGANLIPPSAVEPAKNIVELTVKALSEKEKRRSPSLRTHIDSL